MDEKSDGFCQILAKRNAQKRERQKEIATEHDQTHEWQGDVIENQGGKRDSIE